MLPFFSFKFSLQLTSKVHVVSGTDQPVPVIICHWCPDQTDVNQLEPKPFVTLNKVQGFFLSSFSHASPLLCLQPKEQVQWCRAAIRNATHTTEEFSKVRKSQEIFAPPRLLSHSRCFLAVREDRQQTFKFSLLKAVNRILKLSSCCHDQRLSVVSMACQDIVKRRAVFVHLYHLENVWWHWRRSLLAGSVQI